MEVGLVVCQKVRVQIPLGSPQSKSLLVLLEIKFNIIPKLHYLKNKHLISQGGGTDYHIRLIT